MVLAKKKYYYHTGETNEAYDKENNFSNKNLQRKTYKKSHAKLNIVFCLVIISAAMIFLLLRYTEITEIRYRINKINNEISVMETEIQHLKAQLDQLTRSDIIEEKAVENLNMQYPKYEQMIFLSLENEFSTNFSEEEENSIVDTNQRENDYGFFNEIKKSFQKLYSLLD